MLVSSADGVGTKLKVAFLTGRHDTVGEDLVNHCVNDIAVQGAMPLFFLDYFAVGKLDADVAATVIRGHCARVPQQRLRADRRRDGGDAGPVSRRRVRPGGLHRGRGGARSACSPGKDIREGDVLLGLPSTGLHTNGYSLARKLLFEVAGYGPRRCCRSGATVGDALLAVHRSYLKPIRALMEAGLLQRRGAHHGRRHHRQHAAHAAEGTGRPQSMRRRGRFRRSSKCCARSATFRKTITGAPSTWGSA